MPDDFQSRINAHLMGSMAVKQLVIKECGSSILAASLKMAGCLENKGKLLFCGNGGSAADCQHIAGELVSVLNQNFFRPGLAALALTTDSSILTASANDYGFAGVFERQVQALAAPVDLVIGISTSGNSENVVRAIRYARDHHIQTIALTGSTGGALAALVDIAICVPSSNVQHIQESHITIGHILCDLIERQLFPDKVIP